MINLKQSVQTSISKIKNMLARGMVKLINDAGGVQKLQVALMESEVRSDIEHPQEFGFTSHAPDGSESVTVFYGGNRDNGTVITVFNRAARPKNLSAGESAMYNNFGCKIYLKADGSIEITAPSKVKINSPLTELTGDLTVDGTITATGDITDTTGTNPKSIAQMRTIFNAHVHPEQEGGNTSAPTTSM